MRGIDSTYREDAGETPAVRPCGRPVESLNRSRLLCPRARPSHADYDPLPWRYGDHFRSFRFSRDAILPRCRP